MDKKYDVIIIGAGPGGYTAAIRASQLGLKAAIVEKEKTLGGTCSNIGCIPSKALLDSSEFFARIAHKAEGHGITTGELSIDIPVMMQRKDAIVTRLTGGIAQLMKSNKVDVYFGMGSLAGAAEVRVKGEADLILSAPHIILATGSTVQELDLLKTDGKAIISSTQALSLESVPKSMAVIGAGAIGLELGSVWSRLGCDVSIIEILPQIMAGGDTQLARGLATELKKQGLKFKLNTKVLSAKSEKSGVTLELAQADGTRENMSVEKVLVAAGRKAYWDGLGLDKLGVKLTPDKRHILVDQAWQTSVKGIYAIGDIIPGPMLAHKAEEEAIAVAENLAGRAGHVNYSLIPGVIYTWPEAASVGLSEEALKAQNVEYNTGVFHFNANGRAVAMGETGGFAKILADKKTDRILGAHILGPWASTLIAEVTAVMEFHGSSEDIARSIHAHPTLSEAVKEAALGVEGRMINSINKK